MHCCMEPLGYYCIRFWPVQSCPKSIETTFQRIFLMQCCLEPLGQHGKGFYLCNVVPRVLRQNCTGLFYAMLSGASPTIWYGLWPAQSCLKSIKTTFHRVFSYTKLSGASWTTLQRVFSCAMLSQEY